MTIIRPELGTTAGDSLEILASVQSTYEIKEVRASVEDHEIVLLPRLSGFVGGSLSLVGLTRGQKTLMVTATDIFDKIGTATQVFRHDTAPRLHVELPFSEIVARPSVQVRATCSDDDPEGCRLFVQVSFVTSECGDILVSGIDSVNTALDLSSYDGNTLYLCFQAVDSIGQTSRELKRVSVDLSPALQEKVSVNGRVLDVNADRILYLDNEDELSIIERSSGASIEIPLATGTVGNEPAYLTPAGAIFVASKIGGSVADEKVFDWNNGVLEDLGHVNSTLSLRVAGKYAIWNTNSSTTIEDGRRLLLRDLFSRNTVVVSDSAGNTDNDVSEDGKVAYWGTDYDIHLYNNDTSARLTNDNEIRNLYPSIGGDLIVYQKLSVSGQASAIAMHDGVNETILADNGGGYKVNANWIAFTKSGNLLQAQVWLRNPAGDSKQITYFGSSSIIESLNSNGEVMLFNNGRRYLADFSGATKEINSELGKSIWLSDGWHIMMGGTLFIVDTLASSIKNISNEIPNSFRLEQNFPNPFNPTTTIQFALRRPSFVTLKLYNMLGQEIATLVSENLAAGKYEVNWNARSFPSGVYLYRLQVGEFVETKKLTVLR